MGSSEGRANESKARPEARAPRDRARSRPGRVDGLPLSSEGRGSDSYIGRHVWSAELDPVCLSRANPERRSKERYELALSFFPSPPSRRAPCRARGHHSHCHLFAVSFSLLPAAELLASMKATPLSRPRSSRPSGSGSPAGTAETRAFLSLVRSFAPSPLAPPPVRSLADLTSSLPFAQLLSALDPQAFSLRTLKSPPRGSKEESGDWVAAYNGLRRVHRALVSYAGGSDGQEWSKVKLDLAAMSKGDTEEVLKFCRILFAIAFVPPSTPTCTPRRASIGLT